MEKCISCEKKTVDSVKFPCPKCGFDLMRCNKCRTLSIDYACPKCKFVGP
ncbi:RNA-binding protein [Candidatus Pacearchaeota archaeon]|nr:RNA-binding protein [Candidatus Pacearchaeota archaeon]